ERRHDGTNEKSSHEAPTHCQAHLILSAWTKEKFLAHLCAADPIAWGEIALFHTIRAHVCRDPIGECLCYTGPLERSQMVSGHRRKLAAMSIREAGLEGNRASGP